MSRSYKKHPVNKDNQRGGARFAKRQNNKMARRVPIDEELPTRARRFFTKAFVDQYDVHDFISRWDWEYALAWFEEISQKEDYQYYFGRNTRPIKTVEDFHDWWVQKHLGK